MRKSVILLITAATGFTACQTQPGHNGTYIAHIKGEYSMVDDTIIIKDTVIINNTGYQKIRHGRLLPKENKSKSWTLHSSDTPAMQFEKGELIIGKTIYRKLP